MSIAAIRQKAFDAQLLKLGEDAIYTPVGLESFSTRLIINRGVDDTGQDEQLTVNQTLVSVRMADLPRDPRKNDTIVVIETAEQFTVRKIRSKNSAFARLVTTE